ncbi:MAG: hypothetical protein HY811_08780 [Planctomycetes bacterium]|nr:hypothetical protein [Planctomycetota bacterium]
MKRLQSLDDNKFQWRQTLNKCGIKGRELRQILRTVRDDYRWLQRRDDELAFKSFSLKETISLITYLMRSFEREHWDIIMALYDLDWNLDEIYEKHGKTRRCLYYFLTRYIKKPIIQFFRGLN